MSEERAEPRLWFPATVAFSVGAMLGRPLWIRGLVTVAPVAPLGVLMGMPFPTGIRIVATHGEDSVPWM